jgi:inorganic triphosphatase YgiF
VPEEREIKIPVGTDFVLPDLDGVVEGTHAVDRGTVELSATYWDTDDLTLLRANLGLRHRSAPGETGKWTLKAGSRMVGDAVSREETDFAGPPEQPPQAAIDVIRPLVGEIVLHPIARLVTDRHTVDLLAGDARRAEVADDRVSVRSDTRTVEPFREVEVELFDADDTLIDAVMGRLRAAGVGAPDSTPKYVRALRALGHDIPDREPD